MLQDVGFEDDEIKVGKGLSELDSLDEGLVDPDRAEVLVVEAPGAVRLKCRQTFYCDDIEEFRALKEFFKTDHEGRLNKDKLLLLMTEAQKLV
jgi:hypothetical protein